MFTVCFDRSDDARHRSTNALASSCTISVAVDLEKVPLLNAHEALLRELATNLIFNAVDAMPQGGKILITTRPNEDGVVIAVKDSGIGMTDARQFPDPIPLLPCLPQ